MKNHARQDSKKDQGSHRGGERGDRGGVSPRKPDRQPRGADRPSVRKEDRLSGLQDPVSAAERSRWRAGVIPGAGGARSARDDYRNLGPGVGGAFFFDGEE